MQAVEEEHKVNDVLIIVTAQRWMGKAGVNNIVWFRVRELRGSPPAREEVHARHHELQGPAVRLAGEEGV